MTLYERALAQLLALDEDPRSELCHALRRAIAVGETPASGDVFLTATIAPGGACAVHDQDGRPVAGVKAVECFIADGQQVMRVCL